MSQKFGITVEAHNGSTVAELSGVFADENAAIAFAKDFTKDWHKDAQYFVWGCDDRQFWQGAAN